MFTKSIAERQDARGARQKKELPLPLLFPPIFVAVYLLHLPLLRLPYFWDEGGYYIPAAWDFFRLGTLIPETTVRNAHPPLPSILLAGWWRLTGFHIYSTRLLMCLVTTLALVGVYRLSQRFVGAKGAAAVTLLTAVYPVWFAQSTLAHADMFAAAATVWALSFYLRAVQDKLVRTSRNGQAGNTARVALNVALCFSLAVLSKETAIVTPAALCLLELWRWWHGRRSAPMRDAAAKGRLAAGSLVMAAALAFPALPLAGWYLYHRLKTGFTFGNPEYLRYNATANLSAARILLSMWHRLVHLSVHMNLFAATVLAMVALVLPALPGRQRWILPRAVLGSIGVVVLANWIAFSVLGGALLTRYLLPVYPLLLLACVAAWQRSVQKWWILAAVSVVEFAVGCVVNPPYPFAPEDNLAYADMIRLHQSAIHYVEQHYPGATVLTAWPVAADLQRPELGYLKTPFKTAEIENFTPDEVAKAAQMPGNYDTAIVFSTKYNPPPGGLDLAARPGASDAKYFDAHRDLLPAEIARALGGTVVWQAERHGQWAAVLHFNRSYNARLSDSQMPRSARVSFAAAPPGESPTEEPLVVRGQEALYRLQYLCLV